MEIRLDQPRQFVWPKKLGGVPVSRACACVHFEHCCFYAYFLSHSTEANRMGCKIFFMDHFNDDVGHLAIGRGNKRRGRKEIRREKVKYENARPKHTRAGGRSGQSVNRASAVLHYGFMARSFMTYVFCSHIIAHKR